MIYEVSAMDLRKNLGGMLNRVNLKHDVLLIRRAEQPIAVLIDIDTFYKKVSPSSRSLRDFSNAVTIKLGKYKFDREDANAR